MWWCLSLPATRGLWVQGQPNLYRELQVKWNPVSKQTERLLPAQACKPPFLQVLVQERRKCGDLFLEWLPFAAMLFTVIGAVVSLLGLVWFCFWDRVSLCGWPGELHVEQAGLEPEESSSLCLLDAGITSTYHRALQESWGLLLVSLRKTGLHFKLPWPVRNSVLMVPACSLQPSVVHWPT